jgi:DNA-binding transcriptional ArsR family regulator
MGKSFSETVAVLRALGDENRMRIVLVLRRQSLCVCQIVELVQLAASTVSEHLMILKAAGILASRKEGRWVYYRVTEERPNPEIAKLFQTLEEDHQVQADAKRLERILQIDPAELCRRQRSSGGYCCGRLVANTG